jgi:hypothetical protein
MTNYEKLMENMSLEKLVNIMSYTSPCDFCTIKCGNSMSMDCENGIRAFMEKDTP